ncbi:MAG TPA: Lrp/AsnC ligand binding domain-containing protein [Aggregatilineales bacterium]|nr:Lrp/AsnC ligand binding domain-containing protein [Anaerolineales bacterium]HRE49188.1 Lrp/AsnC ligand binding domain-containing protein [Aggregatilineales bacterium]
MVAAIVLITVERARVEDVAHHLLKVKGISEVFSVAGQFDLVAIVRTETNEQIAEVIAGNIRAVPHIMRTETLIAFKTYSPDDLGAMFSIGNEEINA